MCELVHNGTHVRTYLYIATVHKDSAIWVNLVVCGRKRRESGFRVPAAPECCTSGAWVRPAPTSNPCARPSPPESRRAGTQSRGHSAIALRARRSLSQGCSPLAPAPPRGRDQIRQPVHTSHLGDKRASSHVTASAAAHRLDLHPVPVAVPAARTLPAPRRIAFHANFCTAARRHHGVHGGGRSGGGLAWTRPPTSVSWLVAVSHGQPAVDSRLGDSFFAQPAGGETRRSGVPPTRTTCPRP